MRTTLLTGAGSIENSWGPVQEALDAVFPEEAPVDANCVFSISVFQLRWLWMERQRLNGSQLRRIEKSIERRQSRLRQLKEEIAQRLEAARRGGLIRPRPELDLVAGELLAGEVTVMTTNWDLCIDKHPGAGWNVIHLHGNVTEPSTLYLPTEAIEEPYRQQEQNEVLAWAVRRVMGMLEQTDRLVIYGLSLSPLDPELCMVVSGGFLGTDNPREVIIVDPDAETVCRRLRFLLPRARRRCFAPAELAHRASGSAGDARP